MLEGAFTDYTWMHQNIRPYPPSPQVTSGLELGSQAIFRYALRESDYPTLSLVEPIYDGEGNVIKPGHYELALSDERNFLILLQSKEPVAIIPVFKIEEDDSEQDRLNDRKNKRRLKKEAKEKAKTNAQRAKAGMPPVEDYVNMEASIEYDEKGNFYVIKYERGTIRAWGAIRK